MITRVRLFIGAILALAAIVSIPFLVKFVADAEDSNGQSRIQCIEEHVSDAQSENLEILSRFDKSIEGSLRGSAVPVKFSSELRGSVDSGTILTCIEVGDLTLEAERDLNTKAAASGADGDALSVEEKEALTVFSRKLGSYLYKDGRRELPPQEDFLLRIATYYSEAPAGHELTEQRSG